MRHPRDDSDRQEIYENTEKSQGPSIRDEDQKDDTSNEFNHAELSETSNAPTGERYPVREEKTRSFKGFCN